VFTASSTPTRLTTGWTKFSTSVGVTVSDGNNAAFDELTYSR
jgi:hypothetical protein